MAWVREILQWVKHLVRINQILFWAPYMVPCTPEVSPGRKPWAQLAVAQPPQINWEVGGPHPVRVQELLLASYSGVTPDSANVTLYHASDFNQDW